MNKSIPKPLLPSLAHNLTVKSSWNSCSRYGVRTPLYIMECTDPEIKICSEGACVRRTQIGTQSVAAADSRVVRHRFSCMPAHTHLSLAGCPWIRLISWVARKKIFKLQRPFHKYSPQTQHFPNTLYNTEYADYAEGGCKIASLRFSRKYHRSPPVAPFSESAKKFIRWDSDFKRNF